MLLRLIVLFGGCALGLVIIWKRALIFDYTGPLAFAEEYLGLGGTYTFYLLFGVAVFILSLMYGTGSLQTLMAESFGRFF
jgi:hypothetical protein